MKYESRTVGARHGHATSLTFCSGSWNHRGQSAAFPTGSADGTLQGGGFAGMRISFQEVPLDVRRSAAQRLESIRGTDVRRSAERGSSSAATSPRSTDRISTRSPTTSYDLATGSARVQLVTPGAISSRVFERKGKERAAAEPVRPVRGTGHGFIVASAGPHDFPLPHSSLESPPPSRLLERLAAGDGKEIARVIKLDALSLTSRRTRMASAWRPSATCRKLVRGTSSRSPQAERPGISSAHRTPARSCVGRRTRRRASRRTPGR